MDSEPKRAVAVLRAGKGEPGSREPHTASQPTCHCAPHPVPAASAGRRFLFPISERERSSRGYCDCCSPTKVGLPATNEVLLTLTLAVPWKWPCDSEVQLLLQRAGQLSRVFSVKKFEEEIGMCVVAH